MTDNHLVIMAGGVGSRFWPMSRPENPKQFIDVLGIGRTLIQLTADRFGEGFPADHIWVVTSGKYRSKVREQLPDLPEDNILLEPCMRNTAPCISYVMRKILARHPEATVVVSPADHFVANVDEFRRVVGRGLDFVRGTSRVLTLGMEPTRPDTGYGYIQGGESQDEHVRRVRAFKEKPALDVAKAYLAQGGFYWNSGIFIWDAATADAALRLFNPDIAEVFDRIEPSLYTADEQATVDRLFPECRNISVDYAVMEPLGGKETTLRGMPAGVFVMPASFGWSDLGTWGSLHAQLAKDAEGNAVSGDARICFIESKDCVVRSAGGLNMVLQGLDGYIVAEDNGKLLICKKDQEQRIKQFSEQLGAKS